jgi:methylation protein EvaC
MRCRISKEKCFDVIDFGKMPMANAFIQNKNSKEFLFPLKAIFGKKLSLFQLAHNPSPRKMFNENYPFYTSSSKSMILHFKSFAQWIKNKYIFNKNDLILEIGSNDGTFLSNFNKDKAYGFEPSKSVHLEAKKKKIKSYNKFFNLKNINLLKKKFGKFNIIVGSNVFCHIPDQSNLIKSINKLLNKDGTLIFEEPYLGSMYQKISYDQIYDEHIYMFSASSVKKIYKKYNFNLIDAIPQKTHGGSMRYILKKNGSSKESNRLKKILFNEKKNYIDSIVGFKIFKKKVFISRKKLILKIKKILSNGNKICGYGATSKSTTILNFCKINNKMIECIYDTTPDKIGKYSPGTHIPITSYKNFKKSNYKYVFLFAWNHKKEIMKKEKNNKKIKWFTHLN